MNIFLALGLAMAFVAITTNIGEDPYHRPGLKPAFVTGIVGLIGCFIWNGWMIGK